jgi:hypothetical protein
MSDFYSELWPEEPTPETLKVAVNVVFTSTEHLWSGEKEIQMHQLWLY